jgi:secreted protein with Ig-like and vWFA domain/uncharacterized membrane protein
VLAALTALSAVAGLAALFRHYVLNRPGAFAFLWEGVNYRLTEPWTLGALLIVPFLVWAIAASLADLPWPQRVLALLARVAFLLALALGLGALVRTQESRHVATVFLVDVSNSVSDAGLEDARSRVAEAVKARADGDLVRLVTFAQRPALVTLPEAPDGALPPARDWRHSARTPAEPDPGAGTNIEAALELAYGVLPPGYLKRAVLLSDGLETEGSLLAEASRAQELGVRLFTIPYRRAIPPEIAVRELRLPEKVEIGQPFKVTADVYATQAGRARLRLYAGEALNGLDAVREVELAAGPSELTFQSVVRVGGAVTYRVELEPLSSDTFRENNVYSATLDVPGRPQVLYVEGQPARASYLSGALTAQEFDVDVRPASSFPGSLAELERYDFVIVSDVPREALSSGAQELVERYVRDLGGGFLFAGGEAGFGLGGWAHTTFERILPVRMDSERRKDMPTVAMVLVIDRSGSMTGAPMEMAKAACRATVSTLSGDDLIQVIAFDSEPVRYVRMQPARYRNRIENDIARIQPGGGTEIFPALDMAYQDITVVQARRKHVVLLTDGRSPTQGLRDLVQAMTAEAVTVTTVGLGDQTDQELLRGLAELGGGRFHFVPDPNSLPRIFTRETELVARQAAVEDWFPVRQVTPAAFLKGIAVEAAPLLRGYVSTQAKPPPAQVILESERGEPILARSRVGLGQTLAWTPDVKNAWAVDWIRWPAWSQFWGQLVREHMRQKHRRELPMRSVMDGNTLRVSVDAFTADERFDNGLVSSLVVSGPAARAKDPRQAARVPEIPLRQTAPGRYEASLPLTAYGAFSLRAEHRRVNPTNGALEPVAVSYGHVSNPYPREYARFEADRALLAQAANAGGGRVDPQPLEVLDPRGEKVERSEPLWSRFVWLALGLFLIDLLLRRVRLFDRKVVARVRV